MMAREGVNKMKTLLYVTCHPLTVDESKSLTVGKAFLDAWKKENPTDQVEELDLYQVDVPELNKAIFDSWMKMKQGTPFEELAENERTDVERHNTMLNQFLAADRIVFVNPMWNHFFPARLKQYIDVLCVTGKTFRYTANGPQGLLENKKALHIQAAGGFYHEQAQANEPIVDYGDAYLAHMMQFFGITDYEAIFVEGADSLPDKATDIISEAWEKAVALAKKF